MALYAFDGTWNEDLSGEDGSKTNTNVVRFRNAYRSSPGQTFYVEGVGTRKRILGKVVGGLFGIGGKQRIHEAFLALAANFNAGDRDIDIIGFSRGAALALQFANNINDRGVPDMTDKALAANPEEADFSKVHSSVSIRFLGLWDVVGSFGLSFNFILPFNKINLGYKLSVPANVEQCFHAMALDELRETFGITRVKGHEVWFRGVHSNIGGGYDDRGLSDITLDWMLSKAEKTGLPISRDTVVLEKDINGELGQPEDLIEDEPRTVGPFDLIHTTVHSRTAEVNRSVPDSQPVEPDH